MENIISVTQNKCKQCYSCVRNCPVKAVQIKDGQAQIMYSRCINCGKCISSCPQNAKIVLDSKSRTLNVLEDNENVIACVAPAFVTSFHPHNYKKVIGGLKELGFSEVWEVAVGAEALSRDIDKFIAKNKQKTYISTACPAYVSMIEKHYPEFIEYLLPFVSPMIATGKIIREKYNDRNIKIVFIGPCVAKKAEAMNQQYEGIIDSVLTFEEIKEIFVEKNINLFKSNESEFDSLYCDKGRLFPLSGGLLKNLSIKNDLNESEYICIDSEDGLFSLNEALLKGTPTFKLVDILMCKGCIEGPKIDSTLGYYEKVNVIYDFYKEREGKKEIVDVEIDIDLSREFKNRRNILSFPTEVEIRKVLEMTDKYTKEDELNCGACGYDTCRDKAIAVIQGIAEVDMCLPYLLSKKTDLLSTLSNNLKEITTLKDELETIVESSYDGLMVTDGEGKILSTNNSFHKIIGYDKEEESVQKMEEDNIIFPSATLLVLKEKRRVSFIQSTQNGKKNLATASPIFDKDGKIVRVVTNLRDIEELNRLRDQLQETRRLERYNIMKKKQIDNIDINDENIVANSLEFGEVLQTASNVAGVDSTILILGESGVGKEVVAKFIHGLSKRASKSLIKINCGAIPENLIESELFGYETGAFTGAKKRGKPGLIELAHEGTLFLDEIGDLPSNLQVKLLRVIQDKKLIRIGGTEEKTVDVRILAATNRDLRKMVKEGEFRVDLYYRLNVVPLEIPPLRKRRADILPLSYHFLEIFNKKYGCNKDITASVEKILREYNWPGNVRELENLIERLVVTTRLDLIDEKDLPIFLFKDDNDLCKMIKVDGIIPLKEAIEMLERTLIEEAYERYNTTYEMGKALGVNQSTIVRKIQKYITSNALKHN